MIHISQVDGRPRRDLHWIPIRASQPTRGASAKQLAAVSGHKTTKELDRYTAAADQPTLAGAGIASLPTRR